jgi:hypothetical protein
MHGVLNVWCLALLVGSQDSHVRAGSTCFILHRGAFTWHKKNHTAEFVCDWNLRGVAYLGPDIARAVQLPLLRELSARNRTGAPNSVVSMCTSSVASHFRFSGLTHELSVPPAAYHPSSAAGRFVLHLRAAGPRYRWRPIRRSGFATRVAPTRCNGQEDSCVLDVCSHASDSIGADIAKKQALQKQLPSSIFYVFLS